MPRTTSEDVRRRRAVLPIIKPYLDRFEEWNYQAARHIAVLTSSLTDADQKAAARVELKSLRSDVDEAYASFLADASAISHSRIDDLRNAFERLRKVLEPG